MLPPGTDFQCFSSCLQGEPLRRYFYGLYSQAELNAFEANMFLAEDRILCIEVVAKKVRQQGLRARQGVPWHVANCGAASVAARLPQSIQCGHPACTACSRLQGCNYRLEYIKEAVAEADAVTKLTGLMKQRRRWLNGTFFAML